MAERRVNWADPVAVKAYHAEKSREYYITHKEEIRNKTRDYRAKYKIASYWRKRVQEADAASRPACIEKLREKLLALWPADKVEATIAELN